jgi:hypothetical protein
MADARTGPPIRTYHNLSFTGYVLIVFLVWASHIKRAIFALARLIVSSLRGSVLLCFCFRATFVRRRQILLDQGLTEE